MGVAFEGLFFLFLLAGAGGGAPNPKAPTAQEVLRYAPAEAELMAYADVASLMPQARQLLDAAANHALVKALPELRAGLAMIRTQVDEGLSQVRSTFGIDPIKDVSWAALFVQYPTTPGRTDPAFLVQIHGTFPPDLMTRLAPVLGGDAGEIEGKPVLRHREWTAGLDGAGAFLMGTPAWVEERLSSRWKAGRSSSMSAARTLLGKRPQIFLASAPSVDTVMVAQKELARDPELAFLRDLVGGHRYAALAVGAGALAWSWHAQGKESYQRGLLGSEGLVSLMRAGVHLTRGLARAALAVLPSYLDQVPELRQVLGHENELLALADEFAGDPDFKAQVAGIEPLETIEVSLISKARSGTLLPLLLPAGSALWLMLVARAPSAAPATVEEATTVEPTTAP
jgi:hypothetical protein